MCVCARVGVCVCALNVGGCVGVCMRPHMHSNANGGVTQLYTNAPYYSYYSCESVCVCACVCCECACTCVCVCVCVCVCMHILLSKWSRGATQVCMKES